ncbi:LOW QUALITY PROTEIN: hypothetical protein V1477_000911 [Vespula maculifrons]|uniref:Uncharacterized protein n=1 Tax=Vespula maculifrons TaxID=7453 RepID=A0ABD2D092_VESMC
MSTYLIFNQLQIIHPQFRPKSRSSVLEPSQNFLSSKHDRSCLEMSEADGVDSGAICKRGFIHLQFAEKPEAPEAERHLGSRILEVFVSPWVLRSSNLLAVGPGSEVLALCQRLTVCKYDRANGCIFQSLFQNLFDIIPNGTSKFVHFTLFLTRFLLSGGTLGMGPWAWASVRVSFFQYRKIQLDFHANTGRIGRTLTPVSAGTDVVFSGANKSPTSVGPQMQQPPSGGTWVGSTCDISKSVKLFLKSLIKLYHILVSLLQEGYLTGFQHDRSCLEMSEADGVDGGAICKRGFIHLQFAEKPEAPEAERHLGSVESPLARGSSEAATSSRWDLGIEEFLFSRSGKIEGPLAYVAWHGCWCSRSRLSPNLAPTYSTYSRECFRNTRVISLGWVPWDGPLGAGFCAGLLLSVPKSRAGFLYSERRLFDHAGHANFRVEPPLARGSPDAATSSWWDLGR